MSTTARRRVGTTRTRQLPHYEAGAIDVAFAIKGTYEVIDEDTFWPEHSHPTHELLWNARGASRVAAGQRTWSTTPSIGLWIPAGTVHSGWTPRGSWHRAVQFNIHRLPRLADGPVAVEISDLLRLLLDRLTLTELSEASRGITEAMVIDVLSPAPTEILVREPSSPLLAPIVTALRENPADSRTLAQWAVRLQVSPRTLTRAFQKETGQSFRQWTSALRVQHAVTLLAGGEYVDEVAAHVGFASVSAFTTAFRRVTGLTPGRFGPRAHPASPRIPG